MANQQTASEQMAADLAELRQQNAQQQQQIQQQQQQIDMHNQQHQQHQHQHQQHQQGQQQNAGQGAGAQAAQAPQGGLQVGQGQQATVAKMQKGLTVDAHGEKIPSDWLINEIKKNKYVPIDLYQTNRIGERHQAPKTLSLSSTGAIETDHPLDEKGEQIMTPEQWFDASNNFSKLGKAYGDPIWSGERGEAYDVHANALRELYYRAPDSHRPIVWKALLLFDIKVRHAVQAQPKIDPSAFSEKLYAECRQIVETEATRKAEEAAKAATEAMSGKGTGGWKGGASSSGGNRGGYGGGGRFSPYSRSDDKGGSKSICFRCGDVYHKNFDCSRSETTAGHPLLNSDNRRLLLRNQVVCLGHQQQRGCIRDHCA